MCSYLREDARSSSDKKGGELLFRSPARLWEKKVDRSRSNISFPLYLT